MPSKALPVIDLKHLGSNRSYWVSSLPNLLLRYPQLGTDCVWDVFCMIYLQNGQGELRIDGKTIRMDAPKIIIITPGQISNFNISRKSDGTMLTFDERFFSLRYNNNVLQKFSFLKQKFDSFIRLDTAQARKLGTLFSFLNEENEGNQAYQINVLRSYLNIILFEYEKLYCQRHQTSMDQMKPGSTDHLSERIQAFEKLIEQYFQTEHSVAFYAAALNVTGNYLNKVCKKVRSITAGEIIRRRILIEAQRLLLHTHFSIKEIAVQLGFENSSYFDTFFKRYTHQTPEAFRKSPEI